MSDEAAFQARETFFVAGKDGQRTVRAGSWITADDPIVKTHRHLLVSFSEIVEDAASRPPEVVEQATAAPGEHRNAHPPRKTAGRKPSE